MACLFLWTNYTFFSLSREEMNPIFTFMIKNELNINNKLIKGFSKHQLINSSILPARYEWNFFPLLLVGKSRYTNPPKKVSGFN